MPNLPTLRVINSYREKLDAMSVVFKTPGMSPGAQVSFVQELQSAVTEFAVDRGLELKDLGSQPINVKIEGDGCVVSKQTSWTTLSFVVIDSRKKLQNHKLHRLLAVVEIKENYFQIRESFGDLISEINAVAKAGSISVEQQDVPVSICLGSDLKFLLLVQGLQSASSKYPCPFCRASPKQRCKVGSNIDDFNKPPLLRTLTNMREDCIVEEHGMKTIPLFTIEPRFVVPDVLHMRIRVVNRLIDGLLAEAEDRDNRDRVANVSGKGVHIDAIVHAINSCGVKFEVWKEEKKGKNFSSLPGNACERLLKMLPTKLKGKIDPSFEEKTIFLWKNLCEIFDHFEQNTTGESNEKKVSQFLETFLELGSLGNKGYGADRVTPYIHILAHHAPRKHEEFQCLSWYSSEGIEKKNDILKHLHHAKSNKWNAAADAMKLAKRLEVAAHVRTSRVYRKLDLEYWNEGLIQESRMKRPRCAQEMERRDGSATDIEDMDVAELRTELLATGISTKVKSVSKLRQMLHKEREKQRKTCQRTNE
ncbi:hypothetical protein MTO96_033587 [Rhipicephalus appendiculatus]